MTAQKTTDELKELVREVYRTELAAEIRQTVQETFESCLRDASMMAQPDVEAAVTEQMSPLLARIQRVETDYSELKDIGNEVESINKKLRAISLTLARLSGVIDIIESWPDDLREIRENIKALDHRAGNSEKAIKDVAHEAEIAMAGAAKQYLLVFGNPHNKNEPSLVNDLKTEAATSHQATMTAIGRLAQSVDQVLPQVRANTVYREKRQRIESVALATFKFARNAIEQRKWWLVGGTLATGALALMSDPAAQTFLAALFSEAAP